MPDGQQQQSGQPPTEGTIATGDNPNSADNKMDDSAFVEQCEQNGLDVEKLKPSNNNGSSPTSPTEAGLPFSALKKKTDGPAVAVSKHGPAGPLLPPGFAGKPVADAPLDYTNAALEFGLKACIECDLLPLVDPVKHPCDMCCAVLHGTCGAAVPPGSGKNRCLPCCKTHGTPTDAERLNVTSLVEQLNAGANAQSLTAGVVGDGRAVEATQPKEAEAKLDNSEKPTQKSKKPPARKKAKKEEIVPCSPSLRKRNKDGKAVTLSAKLKEAEQKKEKPKEATEEVESENAHGGENEDEPEGAEKKDHEMGGSPKDDTDNCSSEDETFIDFLGQANQISQAGPPPTTRSSANKKRNADKLEAVEETPDGEDLSEKGSQPSTPARPESESKPPSPKRNKVAGQQSDDDSKDTMLERSDDSSHTTGSD